jgi:hypothetical protein
MCDYSLHAIDTRPAQAGDELVTTEFAGSLTRGFSATGEPTVAVCLCPGTELVFRHDVEYDHPFARLFPRFGFGKIGETVARFRQFNTNRHDTHHDALEFANGKVILLTRLRPGQRATVLQLPAQPFRTAPAPTPHEETALLPLIDR